eukprot:gene3995-2468_t
MPMARATSLAALLCLGAVFGVAFAVAELTKETATGASGVQTVRGSPAQPVRTARVGERVPLGMLPRMPAAFLEG